MWTSAVNLATKNLVQTALLGNQQIAISNELLLNISYWGGMAVRQVCGLPEHLVGLSEMLDAGVLSFLCSFICLSSYLHKALVNPEVFLRLFTILLKNGSQINLIKHIRVCNRHIF